MSPGHFKCFFFRPQLTAISICTSAIIRNEGATSLSLFSAPLCLFSVAGVQKVHFSYFQTASLGQGPCSLQFFLCLKQGLWTHSAELDGWMDWSQRFWQRISHPSRLAFSYSRVWGHFSPMVSAFVYGVILWDCTHRKTTHGRFQFLHRVFKKKQKTDGYFVYFPLYRCFVIKPWWSTDQFKEWPHLLLEGICSFFSF